MATRLGPPAPGSRRDRCAIFIALLAKPISALLGYTPTEQDRLRGISPDGLPTPPSIHHLLGTDNLGRDILVRIIYGSQVSLAVGVGAAVVAVLIGVVVGMCAGFLGPAVDSVLARLMDVVLSFPFLLFAIALATVAGPSELLEIGVIAFFSWASVGRIVRGQTLAIREKEYIEAARALGANTPRIMLVEVLPNLVATVIVYTTPPPTRIGSLPRRSTGA